MFLFKFAKRLITVIVLLVVVVPLYIASQIWTTGTSSHPVKSDVIVVLGAAQFNGKPTPVLQLRIDRAFAVFTSGMAKKIITVGGGAIGDRTTEAQSSANSLRLLGVSAPNLVVVPVGRDTLTSTKNYVAEMKKRGWKSVIVVTDPFHCFRAISMAKDLGVLATCAPDQGQANIWSAAGSKYVVRETGAYLAYKTIDRIGIHLSDHLKN